MSKNKPVKPSAAARETADLGGGNTIRVVSERTGLSMDTLRAWERRYGFPKPERRSGSNRRLYSEADVDRLLAITRALERGYRVGDVIQKSARALRALHTTDSSPRRQQPGWAPFADVTHLVELVIANDFSGLESELRQAGAALGPKRFVTEVAHPFAVAVGAAWADNRLEVRHEHLAAECLTTRLRQLLSAYQDIESKPVVVLGTLPGEYHTLGLQMVALYLAVSGAKPRLIGAATPPREFAEAARALDADVVGLTVTSAFDREDARRGVRELLTQLPTPVRVWIGGSGAEALGLRDPRVDIASSFPAIDGALAAFRDAPAAR